ncbi:two-component regulator propeller domain-containing protein [uncultured Draconibacterium sp.]|uniref:ligand-binding sensor domain-containing protein n=1 Tax=uncultured Draconibacterium sp. TaxID=1573823 RepID=UPI0029BFFA69|nr:two-component regulator propeller domain-containing protein [uncultured Draconibacterium sp.]
MKQFSIYCFIFFFFIASNTRAIEKRYVFNKLSNENGLTYNTVKDIAQEESGIIWFATKQGLNKYDSYNIESYYKEDNVGIPSNFFTCLLITKDNHLFAGTNKGLIKYNRRFNNFEPLLFKGSPIRKINSLTESNSGTILIGTNRGIFCYYPNEEMIVKFVSLKDKHITSIAEYNLDEFIVTSNSGLYFINSDGVLLEYYDKNNTRDLPTHHFMKAYIDSKKDCWLGTYNDGLYKFNRKEKTFQKELLAEIDQAETKVVRDIEEDLDGNLWVCSELGIFILNLETNESVNIQHSLEKSEYHLNDNATYCLFHSHEDIMWIGTYFGGVNYTNLNNSKGFYNIYPGDNENELHGKAVNKLYKDSKGILWIATEDGGVCMENPLKLTTLLRFRECKLNSVYKFKTFNIATYDRQEERIT